MFKEGWLLKGCLRGWLFEAMPANQEMEQAILDNVKLDKNIEDIMKMVLLPKQDCKVSQVAERTHKRSQFRFGKRWFRLSSGTARQSLAECFDSFELC